jgi:hypothetical protein
LVAAGGTSEGRTNPVVSQRNTDELRIDRLNGARDEILDKITNIPTCWIAYVAGSPLDIKFQNFLIRASA